MVRGTEPCGVRASLPSMARHRHPAGPARPSLRIRVGYLRRLLWLFDVIDTAPARRGGAIDAPVRVRSRKSA